jgi:hypothetical protein
MADSELVLYPRGQVGLGSGDLQECTDAKLTLNSGAKLKHTLRVTPSGYTKGAFEVSITLTTLVPETGPERDYINALKSGNPQNFRFKSPTETHTVEGVLTTVEESYTQDDGISETVSGVGRLVDA